MILLLLSSCTNNNKQPNEIIFAITADYPPFEYYANGELRGFDIELARLIATELGLEAKFEAMQFGAIFVALQTHIADAAIATIAMTPERKKNFDFSSQYHSESFALIFHNDKPVDTLAELRGKKIACQLGTTMEIWLKKYFPQNELITMDQNNQVIEALKASYVDVALVDDVAAIIFTKKNPTLSYKIIAKSEDGFGIAFKRNSPLRERVNKALRSLEAKGEIKRLQKKWLEAGVG